MTDVQPVCRYCGEPIAWLEYVNTNGGGYWTHVPRLFPDHRPEPVPVTPETAEPVHGALARAEALLAGDSEWMNRTTWPPEPKKPVPEVQSEADSDIPLPDTREAEDFRFDSEYLAGLLAWARRKGSAGISEMADIIEQLISERDAAVKATAERCAQIIEQDDPRSVMGSPNFDMSYVMQTSPLSSRKMLAAAIRAKYENGDNP